MKDLGNGVPHLRRVPLGVERVFLGLRTFLSRTRGLRVFDTTGQRKSRHHGSKGKRRSSCTPPPEVEGQRPDETGTRLSDSGPGSSGNSRTQGGGQGPSTELLETTLDFRSPHRPIVEVPPWYHYFPGPRARDTDEESRSIDTVGLGGRSRGSLVTESPEDLKGSLYRSHVRETHSQGRSTLSLPSQEERVKCLTL